MREIEINFDEIIKGLKELRKAIEEVPVEKQEDNFMEDFMEFVKETQKEEHPCEWKCDKEDIKKEKAVYLVYVTWGFYPRIEHQTLKSAEAEASRLLKKEWKKVTIFKSLMSLEAGDTIETHYN